VKKLQQVDVAALSTMALPGVAKALWQISDASDLPALLTQLSGTEWSVLGGGSNLLFMGDYAGVLLQLTDTRVQRLELHDDQVLVKVAAGKNWHAFVSECLQQGWFGLENLAAIPGSVGAAPIQNIGAYGVECVQALHSVDVLDLHTGATAVWSNAQCQLSYRDSIFKRPHIKNRWLITSVTWQLSTHWKPQLKYPDLHRLREVSNLSASQVFATIVEIRVRKLPDPKQLANVGSFFKNPIVSLEQYQNLQQHFVDLRGFVVNDQQTNAVKMKVAAAWMIDYCGWKGRRCGAIGVHTEQALVLVNHGAGSAAQLLTLAHDIQLSVWQTFGLWLLPEPEFLGESKQWQPLLQPPSC
jgi:UDP-N-acetylmuramate dehydrogenase